MSSQSCVVVATPWRIRAPRQRAAKERDKRYIQQLECEIVGLQQELHAWERWWRGYAEPVASPTDNIFWSYSRPSCNLDEADAARANCIDYSKWDRLECSSDEEADEEKENGKAEAEKEEENPDAEDGSEYYFDDGEADWDDERGDDYAYEEEEEEEEHGSDYHLDDGEAYSDDEFAGDYEGK